MHIAVVIIIIIASAAILAALGYYVFVFEPRNFKLTRLDISIKDEELKNKLRAGPGDKVVTILHLSDFHLRKDRKGRKLFDFVQGLTYLEPDLVFITGDLVEQDTNQDYLVQMLGPLSAKLAKFAVFGVHDYYNKTPEEFLKNMIKRKRRYDRQNDAGLLTQKLSGIGIKVLENESICLGADPELEIVGIGDSIIERADIGKAFKGLDRHPGQVDKTKSMEISKNTEAFHEPIRPGRLRIAITHTPEEELIAELSKRGVDMLFCGHTHGGQIRLPLIGALISGAKLRARYASGLFYFKDMVFFVSRGLGEGRYSPLRFYCQPEAVLIDIRLV